MVFHVFTDVDYKHTILVVQEDIFIDITYLSIKGQPKPSTVFLVAVLSLSYVNNVYYERRQVMNMTFKIIAVTTSVKDV